MANYYSSLPSVSVSVGSSTPTSTLLVHPSSLKDLSQFTSLDGSEVFSISNRNYYIKDCTDRPNATDRYTFATEKHITVVKKGPTMPLQLEMFPYEDAATEDRADVNQSVGDNAVINASFTGDRMHQSSNYGDFKYLIYPPEFDPTSVNAQPPSFNVGTYWGQSGTDFNKKGTANDGQDISMFYKPNKELMQAGDLVNVPIDVLDTGEDWELNDNIVVEHTYIDSFGDTRKAVARLQIVSISEDNRFEKPGTNRLDGYGYYPCGDFPEVTYASPLGDGFDQYFCHQNHVQAKIISITDNFPLTATTPSDLYNVYLIQKPPIFEFKFPKFSYRYKYEDGEYSVFAPWSEIAFVPGVFDFLPKKGFNLGMKNNLRKLNVKNWVPKNIPKDVVQVDILYKESNSPNIYTVSSHKKDDEPDKGYGINYWNTSGNGGHNGFYTIKSELIHKVVQSNQLLRPWDNVPKKALAQEVTANRLVFANYVQNFDIKTHGEEPNLRNLAEINPSFSPLIYSNNYSLDSDNPLVGYPGKSLKSMRTYQIGVVYRDVYGRETPVLTSKSGSIKIPKLSAKLQNRLSVQLQNDAPYWAESFTFYIKETSNEYYNLAMDRWYDAEDGGIWLSFPSSERNKITETTNLILKKQHDTNKFSDFETKYKVLSLSNDAPTFIKTENKYWGSLPMMLPPPGWGTVGTWDSGMFYNTGLPLPNRMYVDTYAEYWDQSVFSQLTSMSGAQIRVVQSAGTASAYSSSSSDTTNKTRWYDISSITYIGSPPQTQTVTTGDTSLGEPEITQVVELPGQQDQLVRISLEKAFGDDALFCEPTDTLSLSRGLSLEARTKIVRDKAQFEGRFFAKILRDANIESNIVQPQAEKEDRYQILLAKKIKYICAGHPGIQDWSKKLIASSGTVGSGASAVKNFIPIAINYGHNNDFTIGSATDDDIYGATDAVGLGTSSKGVNETLYGIDSGTAKVRLVSSLGSEHSNKGASFVDYRGGIYGNGEGLSSEPTTPPGKERVWPYGPGLSAIGAFDTNDWGTFSDHSPHLKNDGQGIGKKIWPSYRTGFSRTTGYIPNDGTTVTQHPDGSAFSGGTWDNTPSGVANFDLYGAKYDWPSFGPGRWNPYLRYDSDSDGVITCALCDGTNYGVNATGPYADRIPDFIDGFSQLKLKSCPALGGANALPNLHTPINNAGSVDSSNYYKHNYLQGANPLSMPAVWGNQEDFLLGTGPEWNAGTFDKLSEDWDLLWQGRRTIDSWPLASFSPNRWIIDKAGAAQGYSGNGIWDDGNVGYMDLSFWGIGREDSNGLTTRKQSFKDSLLEFHQNEVPFADAIGTVGTQFRFTHDPDQVIYTITKVTQTEVYNYEAPQGSWGIEDGGVTEGGSGIGYASPAPWGDTGPTGPIAGGLAFISDLYTINSAKTGSTVTNRRLRFTLTLDKIVGTEGDHKFHPLYNHVEPAVNAAGENVYKSNIEIGRAKYHDLDGGGVITHIKGGTDDDVEFYNLASYWNTTQGTTGSGISDIVGEGDSGSNPSGEFIQPDEINFDDSANFYTRNPFAYIGLHERGLNQTSMEIVTPYRGENRDRPTSTNPAIWETEPTEDVGLDIYYAASPSYPVRLNRFRFENDMPKIIATKPSAVDQYNAHTYDYLDRGEEVIKVGSIVTVVSSMTGAKDTPNVCAVQDDIIWLTHEKTSSGSSFNKPGTSDPVQLQFEDKIRISWMGEGTFYGSGKDKEWMEFKIVEAINDNCYRIMPLIHNNTVQLGYYNCWSYGTGVESNRIRDDYNAVTIDKGVKASMPLATTYEEERRSSGLIFSGIYNSTSGVNETNQFIQAEPITKDLNPINGSIQKLFARDTDLVTFCENKVFKILANKDALFNADGNTNVTSNKAVLGQAMPFSGDYGISKNPESFAADSYRLYFTDKDRGAVLRLSRDGLTPISDAGMKDWFRDNLRFSKNLIGSFDSRDDQYNLTVDTVDPQTRNPLAYTLSYTEKKRGWESFKSYITQDGISGKNVYYTFPNNYWSQKTLKDPWGTQYSPNKTSARIGEAWQHSIDLNIDIINAFKVTYANTITITDFDYDCSDLRVGMYVEGNGIPIDTYIESITSCDTIVLSNLVSLHALAKLKISTARNAFYNNFDNYSMVTTLFNGDKGTVKRFKTLDYEGTQAKTIYDAENTYSLEGTSVGQIYYDNYPKIGWYVESMHTDMQEAKVPEFINKENKWFNKIIGLENAGVEDNLDTGEFSIQGLGSNWSTK